MNLMSLSCPVFSTLFVCRQLCPLDRCLAIGPDLHTVFCSRSLSRLARRLEDVAYRGRRTFAKRRASEGREAAAEKATRVEKACVRVRLAKADLLSLLRRLRCRNEQNLFPRPRVPERGAHAACSSVRPSSMSTWPLAMLTCGLRQCLGRTRSFILVLPSPSSPLRY